MWNLNWKIRHLVPKIHGLLSVAHISGTNYFHYEIELFHTHYTPEEQNKPENDIFKAV